MWFSTVALKNLLHRKIRSGLTCIGMGVAVCGVVTLVSVSEGFENALTSLFQSRRVDVVVCQAKAPDRLVSVLDVRLGQRLERFSGVQKAEPMLLDVVSFDQGELLAVYVLGWVPQGLMLNDLHLIAGRSLGPSDHRTVLLGKTVAQSLGKALGDHVEIDGADFTIIGVYESFNMFENGTAVVPLAELQALMDRQTSVSLFLVQMEETAKSDESIQAFCRQAEALRDESGHPLGISAMPARDHVKSNFELRMFKAMAWLTSFVALAIAMVGMLNTMMASVFERTWEIGVLRALGWEKRHVIRVILMESFVLSAVGAIVGAPLAIGFLRALHSIESVSNFVPKNIEPSVLLEGCLLAMAAGLVGCLPPAWRAARLLPTEALRHE